MLIKERYRLQRLIGKGGFGKTFLAVDEHHSPPMPCVVKQFWNHNQTPETFFNKTQGLEELGKHPQIPALLAYFQEGECGYLVQEFIPGNNLSTLVAEQGALNETQIWQLLISLLPVLKFIHDRNFIHRDLKPENIICRYPFANLENLFLVDFASAQLVTENNQFIDQAVIGSPEYVCPRTS